MKYYAKGTVKAVDGITFEVPEGSRFGFLGPNGAGKTTTIRCLLGLLQPNKGKIVIFGKEINPRKDVNFRNQIGYLPGSQKFAYFQNPTKSFEIIDVENNKIVFPGIVGLWKTNDPVTGQTVYKADFSKFKKTGEYYIKSEKDEKSAL